MRAARIDTPVPYRAVIVTCAGLVCFAVARAVAGPPVVRASSWIVAGSIVIAVIEEALFRGWLYGRLERFGVPIAIIACALASTMVSIPAHGIASIPVNMAAGLVFGAQRAACGEWKVSALTHCVANLFAIL